MKLHQSKLNHARIMGDKQLESRLRLERETFLNTYHTHQDQDASLRRAIEKPPSHPGFDSRCITAVQWENRKSRILLPGEKSVVFRNSPEGARKLYSGNKSRPLSTVSIAGPGLMPVRPATTSELSRIKKALSIGGSEIRILTATRRSRPKIYVTEPDEAEDDVIDDVIDDVCCDIRKLFEPNEKENKANSHPNNSISDCFTEQRTALVSLGNDGDDHNKFVGKSKIKETQLDSNCNEKDRGQFKRNPCDQITNIEGNIIDSDTEEDDDNIDEDGFYGSRLHSSLLSPRYNDILHLQEKIRQKHLYLRFNNDVDSQRPETVPDNLMYNHKQKNQFQTHSQRDKPKSALKKGVGTRPILTRSESRKKFNLFIKPEGPKLLDIHKQEVEMADYDGRVKEFLKKLIPFTSSQHITDYYRFVEERSRGNQNKACALRFVSRSPEIEGARIANLSRIPSLTFKNVKYDYDSSSSSIESFSRNRSWTTETPSLHWTLNGFCWVVRLRGSLVEGRRFWDLGQGILAFLW